MSDLEDATITVLKYDDAPGSEWNSFKVWKTIRKWHRGLKKQFEKDNLRTQKLNKQLDYCRLIVPPSVPSRRCLCRTKHAQRAEALRAMEEPGVDVLDWIGDMEFVGANAGVAGAPLPAIVHRGIGLLGTAAMPQAPLQQQQHDFRGDAAAGNEGGARQRRRLEANGTHDAAGDPETQDLFFTQTQMDTMDGRRMGKGRAWRRRSWGHRCLGDGGGLQPFRLKNPT